MATSLSKRVSVLSGLHEYTATASFSQAGDFVEMEFSHAVQLCQIAWTSRPVSSLFRLWLIDSTGRLELLASMYGTTTYAMNIATGSLSPRQFDLPEGGKLRLELYIGSFSSNMILLSCLAERK